LRVGRWLPSKFKEFISANSQPTDNMPVSVAEVASLTVLVWRMHPDSMQPMFHSPNLGSTRGGSWPGQPGMFALEALASCMCDVTGDVHDVKKLASTRNTLNIIMHLMTR